MVEQSMEAALEAMLAELVPDEKLRRQTYAVVVGAQAVIKDLRRLDDALYERLSTGEAGVLESADPAAELNRLKDATLQSLGDLLVALRAEGLMEAPGAQTSVSDEIDFDLMEAPPVTTPGQLPLNDGDIDDALGALAPQRPPQSQKVMVELRTAMAAIGQGLQSQLAAFETRFANALRGGHFHQAMEDLDDSRNAANDGLFALVSAVFRQVLPGSAPDRMVPGYLSTLQKALVVRRALAEFSRLVEAQNALLQDSTAEKALQTLAAQRLRSGVSDFLRSDAFVAMRPADRWELMKFHRGLADASMTLALRQTAEGLSKYLESLSSINRREVLQRHDQDLLHDITELMASARPLLHLSPDAAKAQVEQALPLANRLWGRNRDMDALLTSWRVAPPDFSDAQELAELIERLSDVAHRAAGH